MKHCPTCQRVYEDEQMSFCLEDGATLVSASESSYDPSATLIIPAPRVTNQAPTEVLPAGEVTQPSPQLARQPYMSERTVSPKRNSSALPWILGAVILGLAGVIVGMIMMRNSSGPSDSQVTQNTAQPTPTPKPTQTPRSTNTTAVADEPPPVPKQTPTPRRAPISGGVLNGKAISLPKPAYPPIARAARASGTVTVQVTVDESGGVVSARAVGGHPLLQQAAVQAAYGARFSPTLMSGQPVKVTGVITYNFVAQ